MVTQNICQYRSLQYSRSEGTDSGLPEEVLLGEYRCSAAFCGERAGQRRLLSPPETQPFPLPMALLGNLDLLPPPGKSAAPVAAPLEPKGLVSHNGSLIHVGNLLQRAEQQDSGRLYLENKIHTLELKLGEWLRGLPMAVQMSARRPRGNPLRRLQASCPELRSLA